MAVLLPHSVYVHVPKTGGNWIREVLWRGGLVVGHIPDEHIDRWHASGEEVERSPIYAAAGRPRKFAFVRHPADWYRSFWAHQLKWDWPWDCGDGCRSDNFEEFIRWRLTKHPGYVSEFYRTMTRGVDLVEKYETLPGGLASCLRRLGEKFDPAMLDLPRMNVSEGRDACLYPPGLFLDVCRSEQDAMDFYDYWDQDCAHLIGA